MERDEVSGLMLLPDGASEQTTRMIVGQLYRSQIQQGRTLDRQGTILERQLETVNDILNKVDGLVKGMRGPEDGSTPGLQETVRGLSHDVGVLKTRVNDVRETLDTVKEERILMKKDINALKAVKDSAASWKRDVLMVVITILVSSVMSWVLSGALG